jgi:heat shock protein HtpX
MITVVVCEIVFGILASIIVAAFSRHREYRADAGAAGLMGTPVPMVGALRRLGGLDADGLPQNMQAMGISGGKSWMALFSSHPPIESRIAALQNAR